MPVAYAEEEATDLMLINFRIALFLLTLAPNDQKDATKKKTLKRISHIQFAILFSSKICSEDKLYRNYTFGIDLCQIFGYFNSKLQEKYIGTNTNCRKLSL